jgi:hypothetical protein
MSENNENIYLTTQNRRMHKYSKPLTGYLDESDFKKLDRVRDLVFKYEKDGKKLYNPNGMQPDGEMNLGQSFQVKNSLNGLSGDNKASG